MMVSWDNLMDIVSECCTSLSSDPLVMLQICWCFYAEPGHTDCSTLSWIVQSDSMLLYISIPHPSITACIK